MSSSSTKLFSLPEVRRETPRATVAQFMLILLQVAALFAVLRFYQIETQNGLTELLPWFLGAFIVHSWIPVRYKAVFLVLFTWTVILFLFKPLTGSILIALVLTFVFTLHLPIKYVYRILLVIGGGIVLVLLRKNIFYMPRATLAATFAGFFLMFRLIIYAYDVRFEKSEPGIWKRLSYFFMLPNLCFPLFPVVDYKTFLNSQYTTAESEIWRKGVRLIVRGTVHLLLYRIIYIFLTPSPVELNGPLDLLWFLFSSYTLILRMSGVFYIALGVMHLFGYNLPPLFNNFFLIPSFTQIWRRINIYWREFVVKIFYYPIWFRLRKVKAINPLVVTGIITFFITWQLHSWQWFWVLGKYPLTITDGIYWMILGSTITISMLIESNKTPSAEAEKQTHSIIDDVKTFSRILLIFFFMSFLWSLWNTTDLQSWYYVLSKGVHGSLSEYVLVAAIIGGVLAAGSTITTLVRRLKIDIDRPLSFRSTLVFSLSIAGCLLALRCPQITKHIPDSVTRLSDAIAVPGLNQYDKENAEQGYYEQLLEDPMRNNPWEVRLNNKPQREKMETIIIAVNNILQRRMKPSSSVVIDSITISVNEWGMRDKPYSKKKPDGVYRIALLGGSYEMGSGVTDGANYESLLEDQLNKALLSNDSIKAVEILNFAAGGYHLPQHVWLCQNEIFGYEPDAVIYVAHSEDARRLNGFFASSIQNSVPLSFPYLNHIRDAAGATQSQSRTEIRNRLEPYSDSLFNWGYLQITSLCQQHGALPIWLFLPATADVINPRELSHQEYMAKTNGFKTLIISNPYDGYDVTELQISADDTHPNPKGHRVIEEKIFIAITDQQKPVFSKLQFKSDNHGK